MRTLLKTGTGRDELDHAELAETVIKKVQHA